MTKWTTLLTLALGTAVHAQSFPQANGSVVEVIANERTLLNTPEPYACAQDWDELTVLLIIDREGNVKGRQLFLSSNFGIPACTDKILANAERLRFAPDPNARRKEWVFVTYKAPKKE
jgi:hypothetical protein